MKKLKITTLVENTVYDLGLLAEHGLSFWIEYGDKHILFDTGQSNIIHHNAQVLGIDLATADAIILSHGHNDHTGGLAKVLQSAPNAQVYMHPAATETKYSRKKGILKINGMPDKSKKSLDGKKIVLTEKPTQIFPGIKVTGSVPRINNFETTGGDFYLDSECVNADKIIDDQSLYIETDKGLVIIFGCAHSGVVNIMHRIADLSQRKKFYAILGGMHLLHAPEERIDKTMKVFREYNLQKIGPAHCTGTSVSRKLFNDFTEQCFKISVGTIIEF